MRRLYKILLVLFLVFFIGLCLYAFVEPVKAWMQKTIGPPTVGLFGGIATAVTSNPIWKTYIVPFPNQLIIGAIILGFPIAWLWHRSFNRVRGVFVRSAASETKMYPMVTEPKSVPSPSPQPTPTKTTSEPLPKAETIEPQIDKELEGGT